MTEDRLSKEKDFRARYEIPEHWVLDEASHFGIDYFGYLAIVIDLLPDEPVDILDVGCGDGYIAAKLLGLGHRVVGIDYSERAIAYSQILAPSGEFFVIDIVGELNKLARFYHRFDVVVFVEVLEHLPPENHQQILRELGFCLKAGGSMIITVPSENIPLNRWHYKHFSLAEIKHLLTEQGYEIEKVILQNRLSPLFSPLVWRLIQNRCYDLVFARKALRTMFSHYLNIAPFDKDGKGAARYIIKAKRVD